MGKVVKQINALVDATAALNDEQLAGKTAEFRQRIADGESLDKILPEAFAVAREAVSGCWDAPFRCQLIGGMAPARGQNSRDAHRRKDLVATLPAYLNALSGNSVHLITVNDYLASRDANWMQPLYEFLGCRWA